MQNETSPTCEVNSFLIGNVENNCYQYKDSFCEDIFKDFIKPELVNGLLVENKYEKLSVYEFEKNNVTEEITNYENCVKYLNNGWEPLSLYEINNRMPIFSIILFLYSILSSLMIKNIEKK